MRISVEKSANDQFIISIPAKQKKDKNGNTSWKEDLQYTAKTEDEAIAIIKEALKEVKSPEDEYGLYFDQAVSEPSKEKGKAPKVG